MFTRFASLLSVSALAAVVAGATVSCNGVQPWQASLAVGISVAPQNRRSLPCQYTAGNQVIYNSQLYKALQWTYDNAPPTHPDQWANSGTCSQPISNKVSCAGVSAWQGNVAYTTGKKVTFNGQLWSAVQWTEGNTPGDYSGTWQDLGVCQ